MKKSIKIWLEEEDVKKLKTLAIDAGFEGKGSVSHFITKICREPIIFLNENLKRFASAFNVTFRKGYNPIFSLWRWRGGSVIQPLLSQ